MTLKKKLGEGAAAILPTAPLATPEDRVAAAVRRARLYLPCGRGARGKTTWARWQLERLLASGHQVLIADVDRINGTLGKFFGDALRPGGGDDTDVVALVRYVVETMAETGVDGLIDFGGGDLVLKAIAKKMDFVNWLPSIGIDPVLVFFLGAASEDLTIIEDFGKIGFLPKATTVVLNAAAVPSNRAPDAAFRETIGESRVLEALVARGARIVRMPVLEPASAIEERRLPFADAIANRPPPGGGPALGLWCAQQTKAWDREMTNAASKVEEWL